MKSTPSRSPAGSCAESCWEGAGKVVFGREEASRPFMLIECEAEDQVRVRNDVISVWTRDRRGSSSSSCCCCCSDVCGWEDASCFPSREMKVAGCAGGFRSAEGGKCRSSFCCEEVYRLVWRKLRSGGDWSSILRW